MVTGTTEGIAFSIRKSNSIALSVDVLGILIQESPLPLALNRIFLDIELLCLKSCEKICFG